MASCWKWHTHTYTHIYFTCHHSYRLYYRWGIPWGVDLNGAIWWVKCGANYDPNAGAVLLPSCWEASSEWMPADVGDQLTTADCNLYGSNASTAMSWQSWTEINRNGQQNRLIGCPWLPKGCCGFPNSWWVPGCSVSAESAKVTSLWTDFWIILFVASIVWHQVSKNAATAMAHWQLLRHA